MVKEVIWSPEANEDLNGILEFYYYQIKAESYANRLNDIFENEIELIKKHPRIGKSCNSQDVRVKIIGHFQIVYENIEPRIHILRIWDSRQNPSKLSSEHTKK